MTVREALAEAIRALGDVPLPERDARRLLAHVLGIDAGRLSLIAAEPVTAAQADSYARLIARRARREPVSHLTGTRAFYDHLFEVGPDVLDPRPETEVLVRAALAVPFGRVLDLGTGSGCILVSVLAARGQDAFGIGTDISPAALAVAQRNAARAGVADRAQFHAGDWFAALPPGQADFDLILSNPPYIAAEEMLALAPEVRDFEPRVALTDEADGLSAYRRMTGAAGRHLTRAGWLMVEIGPTQGPAVAALFAGAGFARVAVQQDLDGRDRVVVGQRPPAGR